jgi:GH25 family lysozyme M1 (1,4-beta-N-acetylmuramidase)
MRATVRRPRPNRLLRPATLTLMTLSLLAGTAAGAMGYEKGIDVSRYQHSTSLDWEKVQADGVQFAFIKATEGRTYTNPYFAADWATTTQLGLYRGAYHFARPSKGTAAAQAKYFISVAGTAGGFGDLPPVLDLEDSGGMGASALRTWVSNFLQTVESLTGRTPLIYCSPSFWSSKVGDSTAFTRYPLWIAHYTTASQPRVPGGWNTWTFWQNTSSGRVNGISGNVDMNRFNGTLDQLEVLANAAGAVPPPPPATEPPPTTDPITTPASTATTVAAGSSSAYPGQSVAFSGDVSSTVDKADGTTPPVPGRTVVLERQLPGSMTWTQVQKATTDAYGHYEVDAVVDRSAGYRATLRGDSTYATSSSPAVQVAMATRLTAVVDLKRSAARVRKGHPVTLYGHLRLADGSGLAGKQVKVLKRALGSRRWVQIGRGTSLAPTGWWQYRLRPYRSAVYKAVYSGGTRYRADVSNLQKVYVRR